MQRFLKLLTGGRDPKKMIILGLDGAGKTSILYKMKVGEIMTVLPTIGFNVEEVHYKDLHINCWDIGGCDKIRPLWRHYTEGSTAFIFIIDSNDRERIGEAQHEFSKLLSEFGNIPVLIFANKQDLPNAMSVQEITDKMGLHESLKGRDFYVQASCAISGDGLYEGFDWLSYATKSSKVPKVEAPQTSPATTTTVPQAAGPPPPPQPPFKSTSDKYTQDDFLQKFQDCTLDCWDHKTHIRIAYTNLKLYGRMDGLPKIRDGIKNFIANSTITFKNRFHETMTYFWVQMVHYAMATTNMVEVQDLVKSKISQTRAAATSPASASPPSASETTTTDTANDSVDPGFLEFDTFLEKNIQLMNGGLFLQYYSKDLMLNNADSRTQLMLPDIKPLPNIAVKEFNTPPPPLK